MSSKHLSQDDVRKAVEGGAKMRGGGNTDELLAGSVGKDDAFEAMAAAMFADDSEASKVDGRDETDMRAEEEMKKAAAVAAEKELKKKKKKKIPKVKGALSKKLNKRNVGMLSFGDEEEVW
jgi:hypothetical protein